MNITNKIGHLTDQPSKPFFPLLLWILFFNVILFVAFVVVQEGLWQKVLATDQSKISLLIVVVFVAASLYLAYHLYRSCCYLERTFERLGVRKSAAPISTGALVDGYLQEMAHINQAHLNQTKDTSKLDQANYIFEIYVDQLRSPLDITSFWSDVLIRLGLIGTIVGFIMMLQSFVQGAAPSEENIQALLITMSTGMGTALYTTFAGLVASTLLGLQHQLLSTTVEKVIAGLIRLSDQEPVNDQPTLVPDQIAIGE